MRLIDAEWITYVLRKIAQAEDKDLSKGEFGQGYVSGVYHAIHVIKSTEACLPRVCKHCHLVQYHDNNYCDRCGRLIDEAPTVEECKHGHWKGKSLAEAEIIRAKGVAEANRIIGDSLKNNEAYLRYLWIRNLEDGPNQIIYVPTEANLPLLESSRHIADNLLSKGVLND